MTDKIMKNAYGIEYELKRKRITRMHIYIKSDGRVVVTAPISLPERKIEVFIHDKEGWIRKHQKKAEERPAQEKMQLRYESGEELFFWGKQYGLTVITEEGRTRSRLELIPEPVPGEESFEEAAFREAKLFVPESFMGPGGKDKRARVVIRKYKEILEREAEPVLDKWSSLTGLNYDSWHTRYMKSRWGSCIHESKRICLNIRLAERSFQCLDYVALHEIAHIKEPNHGPRFKAILDRYMPSWREAEKSLK